MLPPSLENENWKECYLDSKYLISDQGRVWNTTTKRFLKGTSANKGYIIVKINNVGKYVHRLVYQTFKPTDNFEEMTIDHINGKRDDNRLENLQILTQTENVKLMMITRGEMHQELTRLIQKYGYNEVLKRLREMK